ncbi:MAG: hypothetical protein J7513_16785 [Solirubrobacteraceae bacterium]|nr:hypothetical protein [Solirubrobacteraceae bacterium]
MAQIGRHRRLLQLLAGLWLYGATMALMVKAGLGLDPWDVFHEGLTKVTGLSFGTIVAIVGAVALLAWIPLRQRPGIGTVLNIIVIAISVDATLAILPDPASDAIELKCAMALAGILGNGLAGALYVGAGLGTGPRDGLWVGLVARTGASVRLVRTILELSVFTIGLCLGGTANIATVVYALAIGPIVQALLPRTTVPEGVPMPQPLRPLMIQRATARV